MWATGSNDASDVDIGMMSDESEERLSGSVLRIGSQDWNSGDNCWIVDVLGPPNKADTIFAELKVTVFKGKPFQFHKNSPEGKRTVVTVGQSS